MTTSIPDLWSEDIAVDVLTPYAILQAQCDPISRKTKGIVTAEVEVAENLFEGTKYERLALVVEASILAYREEILSVEYRKSRMYPCNIVLPERIDWTLGDMTVSSDTQTCKDEVSYIQRLALALRSPEVNGTILTLISRSLEKNPKAKTA